MKMYFLVLYNLSPIQQGIQAGHAAVEYIMKYNNNFTKEFATDHKTFIILNGGTTQTMDRHIKYLSSINHSFATFNEPDLGNIVTAVSFITRDDDEMLKYFTNNFKLA